MSEDIYSQFLRFDVTESAAATFTEGSAILTGASVNRIQGQNIALEIHAIGVAMSHPADLPSTGASEYVKFTLSTRSGLAASPAINEEHVVYQCQTTVEGGVGTYVPLLYINDNIMPPYVEYKHPLLISHAKLYPYVISSNSAAAATVKGYILFTYVLLDADLAIEALESFR